MFDLIHISLYETKSFPESTSGLYIIQKHEIDKETKLMK